VALPLEPEKDEIRRDLCIQGSHLGLRGHRNDPGEVRGCANELRLDEEELPSIGVDEERPLEGLVGRDFIADVKLAVGPEGRGMEARHAKAREEEKTGVLHGAFLSTLKTRWMFAPATPR
jgi:hypothetical protein